MKNQIPEVVTITYMPTGEVLFRKTYDDQESADDLCDTFSKLNEVLVLVQQSDSIYPTDTLQYERNALILKKDVLSQCVLKRNVKRPFR